MMTRKHLLIFLFLIPFIGFGQMPDKIVKNKNEKFQAVLTVGTVVCEVDSFTRGGYDGRYKLLHQALERDSMATFFRNEALHPGLWLARHGGGSSVDTTKLLHKKDSLSGYATQYDLLGKASTDSLFWSHSANKTWLKTKTDITEIGQYLSFDTNPGTILCKNNMFYIGDYTHPHTLQMWGSGSYNHLDFSYANGINYIVSGSSSMTLNPSGSFIYGKLGVNKQSTGDSTFTDDGGGHFTGGLKVDKTISALGGSSTLWNNARQLSNHDSLINLDERSYNSLTDKPTIPSATDTTKFPWKYSGGKTIQRGTGNVGLNTATPNALLDVEGTGYTRGGNGDANSSGTITSADALYASLYPTGALVGTPTIISQLDCGGLGFVPYYGTYDALMKVSLNVSTWGTISTSATKLSAMLRFGYHMKRAYGYSHDIAFSDSIRSSAILRDSVFLPSIPTTNSIALTDSMFLSKVTHTSISSAKLIRKMQVAKVGDLPFALTAHTHPVATDSATGFMPMLNGEPGYFLNGNGNWSGETDPNISAWARAGTKPTYTYSEVGAEPSISKSTGFLKWTGSAWSWDNSTYVTGTPWTSMGYVTGTPWTGMGYLTGNQTITLGGVLSGSGTTSITASAGSGYYMPSTTDQTNWNAKAAPNQTMYLGTTAVAINRGSGALSLADVSITGSSATCTGNAATSTTASGLVTGTYSVSVTGSSSSCTGNAATATKLAATKTINGVAFDGSGNITVPSDIAPGTSGNVLTSNGSAWTSAAPTATAAPSIWTAVTGSYASGTTFTFTGGSDQLALLCTKSLFQAVSSTGATGYYGYIKSAVNSGGTVTCTVVSTSALAAGAKNFYIAYTEKITGMDNNYRWTNEVPGVITADASNYQGKYYMNTPDTMYFVSVMPDVMTAASGTGAAATFNIYDNTTAIFGTAPDMTTNTTLADQVPATPYKITPGHNVTVRWLTSAGATTKISDASIKITWIPSTLIRAK